MLRIEEGLEAGLAPNASEDGPAERTSAARVLELAAVTAHQLVADATDEAASLVAAAQTEARAITEAGRAEADRVAGHMARSKAEQAAELDRERGTALAGLAEEKAALEAGIAALHRQHTEQHGRLRTLLTEQLALLDAAGSDPHPSLEP